MNRRFQIDSYMSVSFQAPMPLARILAVIAVIAVIPVGNGANFDCSSRINMSHAADNPEKSAKSHVAEVSCTIQGASEAPSTLHDQAKDVIRQISAVIFETVDAQSDLDRNTGQVRLAANS